MAIKIATWNMAYWSHKRLHTDAWDCFFREVGADIYLFQEGRPIASMTKQKNHLVWKPIGGRRDWGSGIYSEKYEIIEEIIQSQFKNVFSVGNTNINNKKITLISIYGMIESTGPTRGYSIPNLHRMISDLTGLFNGHIGGKRSIIMAGDLNASIQLDKKQRNNSHKILFDRIEDFGLQNIYKLSGNKGYVQTLRHARSKIPWQNDYFFISKSFEKNFKNYRIIDNIEICKYSDHHPVVIEMDL